MVLPLYHHTSVPPQVHDDDTDLRALYECHSIGNRMAIYTVGHMYICMYRYTYVQTYVRTSAHKAVLEALDCVSNARLSAITKTIQHTAGFLKEHSTDAITFRTTPKVANPNF